MMITGTAASGRLGRLVIEERLVRGVRAEQIVAAARTRHKAADLAGRGRQLCEADYSWPETLASAFAGTDKLLLISSDVVGQRYASYMDTLV
jgi:NAD(P)H dehydrogenase (quinone)